MKFDKSTNRLSNKSIKNILKNVSKLLGNIVSEEEIKAKLHRAILFSEGEKAYRITRSQFEEIFKEVKDSLLSSPISIHSKHYSERLNLGNDVLYHIHTFKPEKKDIIHAVKIKNKSKMFLDSFEVLIDVTDSFFTEYNSEGYILKKYQKQDFVNYVSFTTIDDAFKDFWFHKEFSKNRNYSIVVKTEKTPEKFIKFFKNFSEDSKKYGLKVWVVNVVDKTIDPFIGYPKDLNLIKNFKNPKVAGMISSMWREKVEKIDLD